MKSLEEYLEIAEGLHIPPEKLAVARDVLADLSTREEKVNTTDSETNMT